jgi:hypothetical protein
MSAAALKEDNPFGYAGRFVPGETDEKDAERRGSVSRKYSRIEPVLVTIGDGDSDKADIARQIELEANAAIKYRTCTWQKVGLLAIHNSQSLVVRL